MKLLNYAFLITGLTFITYSCSKQPKNAEEFGEFALNKLISNSDATELYIMPSDSNFITDKYSLEWFRETPKNIDAYTEHINKTIAEIHKWRTTAIGLNITNKEIKYLRTERTLNKKYKSENNNLVVYFLFKNKEHYFKLLDVDSLNGKWVTYGITEPTNDDIQKEKRLKEAGEPYIPWIGLYIDNYNFSYSELSPKTLSKFYVTIKNYTPDNFRKIKFKLTVYVKERTYEREIFSKTIERNELLSSDDVIRFEILDLRDFYVGVDLSNKNKLSWNVKIIDAKPRPGYEDLPY